MENQSKSQNDDKWTQKEEMDAVRIVSSLTRIEVQLRRAKDATAEADNEFQNLKESLKKQTKNKALKAMMGFLR